MDFIYSPNAIEFFGFHPESQKEYLQNPVNPVFIKKLDRLEGCREMSEHRRLIGDAHSSDVIPFAENGFNALHHIIHVTLGVNAPGNRQPYHFQSGRPKLTAFWIGFTKHHTADFTGTDAAAKIKLAGQCLTRIGLGRDMRQKCLSIQPF